MVAFPTTLAAFFASSSFSFPTYLEYNLPLQIGPFPEVDVLSHVEVLQLFEL
jgi:hypothetical protein